MISFKKKILTSYLIVLLIIIAIMFPIASQTVQRIVYTPIWDRAYELIDKIYEAPDNDALVQRLKDQKFLTFFRVSVITDERKVLYDSYTKRLLGPRFDKNFVVNHPEVEEAFKEGWGFHEGKSKLLDQQFAYFALAFDFHGKTYVLRAAFPSKFVDDMTYDFEVGFIGLSAVVLILFSAMAWLVIQHLTQPINQIITAVKPYQEGRLATLPEIKINAAPGDDFGKLASTLNSLSAKVQSQINSLMQERNEKEAVLESLVEGVIAVNNQMNITYANQAASKLLNIDSSLLIGKPFKNIQNYECIHLLECCQKKHDVLTDTVQLKYPEGKVYLDIVAAPLKNNGGAVLVLQDKTTHYKLMDMRKDFIANASHELKTPITIIRGFAETLHDHPTLPAETSSEITNKIVHNCKRMTTLIKDLLILTDIENIPDSRLIECDLDSLMTHCCSMIKEVHPDAIINFKTDLSSEAIVKADPSLLELAFLNLLENAAKYSPRPPEINITMTQEDNKVKLQIADKGIGIPANDLEHIFERFYTVNKAHSRKLGGSGLGLSIVRTIIEKHFGAITVASELGKGTTFSIYLPIETNV